MLKRSVVISLSGDVAITRTAAGTWRHNEASVFETVWRVYQPSLRTAYIIPNTHLIIVLNSERIETGARKRTYTHTRARVTFQRHAHTYVTRCVLVRARR